MTVAHDLNPLEEHQRKDAARNFVFDASQTLYRFRQRTSELEAGDEAAWHDARSIAQDLIRGATPLQLGLLVACGKEVMIFADRFFAGEPLQPDLTLYMLSALDTVGMELERLQHDRDLR
jgi:hypothetical protein